MPPSRASRGTLAPPSDLMRNNGVRIWIPLPVAVLGALLAVLAVLLVLGPTRTGSIVALAFFGLLPGLAVVRLLRLRDAPLELVLGIALSFAVAGLISVTQAYFGGWSPMLTLGALVVITACAVLAPLVASLVRLQRGRSSVAEVHVAAAPVAAPRAVAPRPTFAPLVTLPRVVTPAGPVASPPTPVPPIASPPAVVTPAAIPAPAPVGSADPAPAPPARAGRGSSATSDLPPPPPIAVIRKRPKAGPAATAGGGGPESRPSRATRATIDRLVDDLADQRDETSS